MASKKPKSNKNMVSKAGAKDDSPAVFAELRRILAQHEPKLHVNADKPDNYYLETISDKFRGRRLCFGAVSIKKDYVSYYLMPIYMNSKLQATISPELHKRMQGKACFSFTAVDPKLFRELSSLTGAGLRSFASQGIL